MWVLGRSSDSLFSFSAFMIAAGFGGDVTYVSCSKKFNICGTVTEYSQRSIRSKVKDGGGDAEVLQAMG